MTTLNDFYATRSTRSAAMPEAEVFGVSWPLYKLHALIVALVSVPLVLGFGGAPSLAAWIAGGALVSVWWVERILSASRCDHGEREYAS